MKLHLLNTALAFVAMCMSRSSAAQQPVQRFDDILDIFFDASQKSFVTKKVAELYFISVQDTSMDDTPNVGDTIFYQVRKNGQLKNMIWQRVLFSKDSVWLDGHDTIAIGPKCKQRYYCECLATQYNDSLVCDSYGRVKYMRDVGAKKIQNFYSADGSLREKRIMDSAPEGTGIFKILYYYDKAGRLIHIDHARGQASKNTPLRVTDVFVDFEFPVVNRTLISYTSSGRVSAITDLFLSTNNEFVPAYKTTFVYNGGLLKRVDYFEYESDTITWSQNVGYKFY